MSVRILVGDVRARLADLPSDSVHCAVTSPPYWGLRAYGTDPQTWDGEPGCRHEWGAPTGYLGHRGNRGQVPQTKWPNNKTYPQNTGETQFECIHCGAWRGELGCEPTPDLFISHLVDIFRGVRRVLRPDGTLWLNMGDCYAAGRNGRSAAATKVIGEGDRTFRDKPFSTAVGGLKPKDLVMMPSRLALALQADGWWVRSEIVWHKPNPMPESIKDRPTMSHEKIFLLSKSPRYHFDAEAVREPSSEKPSGNKRRKEGAERGAMSHVASSIPYTPDGSGRHIRNVWTIATRPYREAHFATFPPKLVEPCIKAGCPEGGTVLDPFGGAGTTGLVAKELGRSAVLIELNRSYAEMARRRIGDALIDDPEAEALLA